MNNRIKILEDQINRSKFAQENNVKILEKVSENLIKFTKSCSETTKAYVERMFPELLDDNYVNSLKDLSYEELMQAKDKLLTLENSLLDVAEEILS